MKAKQYSGSETKNNGILNGYLLFRKRVKYYGKDEKTEFLKSVKTRAKLFCLNESTCSSLNINN